MTQPYERFAPYYDAVYGQIVDYAGDIEWLDEAWGRHSKVPVRRVLDLGCGTGEHARRIMASGGAEVVGVDLSPGLVDLARAKVPGARFHVADMSRELPEGPFDAAISMFGAFCYLPTDADVARMLALLRDRLVPGATFAFETWSPYGWRPEPRWENFDLPDGRRLLRFRDPSFEIADDVFHFSMEHLVMRGDDLEEQFVEEHALRLRTPFATKELIEAHGFEAAAVTTPRSFEPPAPDAFRVMFLARRT